MLTGGWGILFVVGVASAAADEPMVMFAAPALDPSSSPPAALAAPLPLPRPEPGRAVKALELSFGITAGMVIPGLLLFGARDDRTRLAGLVLAWNGVVGGPAVGSFYGGHPGVATLGLAVRGIASTLALGAAIDAGMNDSGRSADRTPALTATVLTGAVALIEPLVCFVLRLHDESQASSPQPIVVSPTVFSAPAGRATPALAMAGVF